MSEKVIQERKERQVGKVQSQEVAAAGRWSQMRMLMGDSEKKVGIKHN